MKVVHLACDTMTQDYVLLLEMAPFWLRSFGHAIHLISTCVLLRGELVDFEHVVGVNKTGVSDGHICVTRSAAFKGNVR